MITNTEINKWNDELLEIWKSFIGSVIDKNGEAIPQFLSPCFISDNMIIKECKLLVIGLNPSYSYKNWKKVLRKEIPQNQNVSDNLKDLRIKILYHSISTVDKNKLIDNYCIFSGNGVDIKDLKYLDSTSSDKNEGVQYFLKIREIAEETLNYNNEWRHLDIFYYRETEQNKIKNLIQHNDLFFKKQMELTKKIITRLEPSMILISNAFAGEKFRQMFSEIAENNSIDESKGTYLMKIGNRNIPVFFSGMLSGQRALDLGTYDRLKWHMKAVAEGKSMKN